ncbi:TadE/TadG family type IV pilus assembly protein [Rhizobium sp. 18065]|uniref:TadE/TadG family type IV pilus assembly protein n=1 Tax=Rhizobium sp. 18065 TaxID=2681411 RepID=UPI001FCE35C4|nr:TadE/TadG family type IV pilus assembly protein [Rhizobium sp. 18065]
MSQLPTTAMILLSGARVLRRRLGELCHDRAGVGGVEFALIAPMLLVLYLGAFELTMGLSVNKKVSLASSTVADLVARQEKVTKADLTAMSHVAQAIFVPYAANNLLIKISAIQIDDSATAKVAWSWSTAGDTPYPANSVATVPFGMVVANSFLIRTELTVSHQLLMYMPNFSGSEIRNKTLGADFYFRQRVGDGITCTDC